MKYIPAFSFLEKTLKRVFSHSNSEVGNSDMFSATWWVGDRYDDGVKERYSVNHNGDPVTSVYILRTTTIQFARLLKQK